jgi:poly(3-hydroxybutyrate) depolymerase/esterase/lipase
MKLSLSLALALLATLPAARAAEATGAAAAKPYLSVEQLRAKYQDRKGRYATIGGVQVYYKDEGQGPAILLIHGSQSTLRTWDYVAPVLVKRGYRVIRYDMPPQGLSGPVSAEAAKSLTPAGFVAGLLDHAGIGAVDCVGVSSGGTTCMYFAATFPDRVRRLVMSNSPSDPVENAKITPTPEFEAAQREAKETGFQSQRFWNAFLDFFSGVPSRLDAGIREQYYDVNRRQPEPNYTALIGLVRDPVKTQAAMASVRCPTLLIWGARDQLLPPAAADTLAGYLRNTQVSKVFLPDVGHYPPLEVPARFAQLVLAYLEVATPAEASSGRPDGLLRRTRSEGGLERHYWLRPASRRVPGAGLVIVLHGSNDDGRGIRETLGRRLEPLADAAGYAVAYPDGFEKHWNDCRAGASYAANRRDVDDPAFLRALVAAEVTEHGIDPRRVFAIGMSNGGQMVLRLALEDPAAYAALAVIAASLPAPAGRDCRVAPGSVPIAFFNGTADPINPFDGGLVRVGNDVSRGYVLSSPYTAQWFARRAGHAAAPLARRLPDRDPGDRSRVEWLDWSEPGRPSIRLYAIEGGGHTIPGSPDATGERRPVVTRDIDAAVESWRFFQRHADGR